MTILLTGGAGYIGSHTAVELLNSGHSVIIADNYINSSPEVLSRIEKITGVKVPVYPVDLCNIPSLKRIFGENRIDAAIHFAGLKSVGESVNAPLKYYRNNLDGTMSLLEVMEEYGISHMIFSSSATVYGVPDKLPITENTPVGPCTNPYGWTKLMIERILMDYCKANPEFSAVSLRYFNPVGAHKSGLLGEAPAGIPNNLMPYIAQVALGKLPELKIFGNDYPTPDGTGVRDYIHVVDLARGHIAALDYCLCNAGYKVFNLGTGNGLSVLDIVRSFEKVNAVTIPYQVAERRDGDIASCYADASKAEKLMGWKAKLTLDDMCRDTWNWQKSNPNGFGLKKAIHSGGPSVGGHHENSSMFADDIYSPEHGVYFL